LGREISKKVYESNMTESIVAINPANKEIISKIPRRFLYEVISILLYSKYEKIFSIYRLIIEERKFKRQEFVLTKLYSLPFVSCYQKKGVQKSME
jgi:hypothetical protein